jgi:formate hydrogenlyase transcriptional activator
VAVVEITEQKKLEQSLQTVTRTVRQQRDRLQALLELNTTLITHREPTKLIPAISEYLQRMIPHEYATITVHNPIARSLVLYPLDSGTEDIELGFANLQLHEMSARAHSKHESKVFRGEELMGVQSVFVNDMITHGIRSLCCVPLSTPNGELGTLNLASSKDNAFQTDDVKLLEQVASQFALALNNARAYHEIDGLKDKLAKERVYLQEEIRTEHNFEEIIGDSEALNTALRNAKTVAASPATVLILGETGTGKELIARAIHRMSARKDAAFVKLNCAAIPTGLLESELFGHEKGAFTGAISQKIGRLELADKGTLFLDEVGDIPLELQPKLLRVLQDQEFERLGSTRTLKVSIRLVAATNRDLARSVREREFRSDLYYRLNVFPIKMPTLRERRTDIPQLVRYFVQKFARELDKQIDTIPKETLETLKNWDWPGNVRELENFIERSVILSEGSILRVPLSELNAAINTPKDGTLEDVERQHIISALRESGGVIAGPQGAAARLGLKRTTLQSRMERMGIVREEYE